MCKSWQMQTNHLKWVTGYHLQDILGVRLWRSVRALTTLISLSATVYGTSAAAHCWPSHIMQLCLPIVVQGSFCLQPQFHFQGLHLYFCCSLQCLPYPRLPSMQHFLVAFQEPALSFFLSHGITHGSLPLVASEYWSVSQQE